METKKYNELVEIGKRYVSEHRFESSTNELYHYGVKGMKWGVRRTHEQLSKIRKSRSRLDENKSEILSIDVLNRYKSQYRNLGHIKIDSSTNGRLYTRNGKVVAMINTEKKSDGSIWIQGLEVFGDNQGQGLGRGLLDVAVNDLGATHLSVRKTNSAAKRLYDDYGFVTYKTDGFMDYMKIRK